MIGLLIRYRHILGYGLAVCALVFCVWYIHHKGYQACQRDAMAQELTHQVQATKDRREDEKEVQSYDHDAVVDELRVRGELRRTSDY